MSAAALADRCHGVRQLAGNRSARAFAGLAALGTTLLITGCAGPAFDLQGHRGARGLAPENTLAAFIRALDIGVTTLELDIGVTRDGVVVVHHDERLNPNIARNASGAWVAAPAWLGGGRMPVEIWMVRQLIDWEDHEGLEEIGIAVLSSFPRASLN